MKVAYSGFFLDPTGYGEAARRTVKALLDAGVAVRPATPPYGVLTDGSKPIRAPRWLTEFIAQPPYPAPDRHLIHVIGNQFGQIPRLSQARRVGLTCWETDRPHPAIVEGCKQVDQVIVPSGQNLEAFSQADISAALVPYPIMAPTEEMAEIPAVSALKSSHLFYWIGSWQRRKNPEGAVTAFLLACAWNPAFAERSALVMKVSGPMSLSIARNEISTLRSAMNLTFEVEPQILILGGDPMPPEQVAWLHKRGTCYLSLARGEGFGFAAADAMWMGRPIIATGWGGSLDFLEGRQGVELVKARMSPVVQHYPLFSATQRWGDPSLDAAARSILRVMADPHARERIYVRDLSAYSSAAVAARLKEALSD